jgi:putative nucleotidyltransferase with HDIG domain
MTTNIEAIIEQSCDLPMIPSVAARVIALVIEPKTTAEEITHAILVDQALSSRVLKIANSSFYGCRRTINSIQHATVMVGFDTVRNIVVTASTQSLYNHFGLTEKMLHDHSVCTAMAAHRVAVETGFKQTEQAFLGGLLHDIGKVILNNTDPARFTIIMKKVYNEGADFSEAEREVFGFTHSEVGRLVLKKWNFSSELEKVVQYHHDHKQIDPSEGPLQHLTAIVNLADALSYKLGIGVREPQEIDLSQLPAATLLKIGKERGEKIEADLRKSYEKESALFT